MFAPNAPHIRRSLPEYLNVRTVALAAGWAFAALWPFAAFALLAFVVADPLVTSLRLLFLAVAIAAGSGITAVIDSVMLSNKTW